MTRWPAGVLLLLFAAACSVNVAHLDVVAAHAPLPDYLDSATSHGVREGESCRLWILGVPFGLPQVDEAVGNALAPVHGAFMRDATVYSEHPVYVVYGWHCYRVRGEVFSVVGGRALSSP